MKSKKQRLAAIDPADRPITPREQRLIKEYLVDLNQTQAAIRAGYSEKSARTVASETLAKPNVKAALDKALARLNAQVEAKTERVLEEMSRAAFFDPADVVDAKGNLLPINKMPEHARRAIAGFEYGKKGRKIRFVDKGAMLERLAKMRGLLDKDRPNDVPAVINFTVNIGVAR